MTISTLTAGNWQGNLKMGLAPRELEATLWAAADLTVKEIGRVMGISPNTAEKRLESARLKLGAKTMRGLVVEAFRRGLIAIAAQPPAFPDPQRPANEHDGVFIA
ncbi:response regulator transcription factor [Pseudomonas sp. B21-053]|uniref:response regulator transcription factor n=1 Tax=Pseudomonas sp. B21-053 TaxID=2895493 RepID=UPI002231A9A4|nr:helix-turn-helix domain-containing protein [Pseudomonas sp. B21-053]UZE12758.1 helix-turn-helix domain-containing protein [Pseudomonas sp. B21-053]